MMTYKEMFEDLVETAFFVCHECSNDRIEYSYIGDTDIGEYVRPDTRNEMYKILRAE